jgi:hypothetical protein
MSDKRFLGNIITSTPTAPAGPYQDGAAPGVWSLQEAFTYTKAGLWPTAGNVNPIALTTSARDSDANRTRQIDTFQITTAGNATDFGSLTLTSGQFDCAGFSDAVKGFEAGGTNNVTIQTMGYSTGSLATDFGDLTTVKAETGGYSNSTRGLIGGQGTDFGGIDYVTMASAGNAVDFGDFSSINRNNQCRASGSQVKAIYGPFQSDKRVTDFVVPQTTGNGTDFATLSTNHEYSYNGGDLTRIIIAGGSGVTDVIEYNSIASSSGWTDFGDLVAGAGGGGCVSNSSRMVTAGGYLYGFAITNSMSYLTISTTGNATDFGDLTTPKRNMEARAPSTPSVTG